MGAVTVDIVAAESRADPPGADLTYVVRNEGDAPVWVVDDGWLAWRQEDGTIELGYARVPMQPGVEPFGYFSPQVAQLAPAAELTRSVSLSWPQRLDGMWNASDTAAPRPGDHRVVVRIGYGETPGPDPPALGEGVEAPVLAWQHEAVSEPATLAALA
jgi:hypothetical protein